MKLFIALSLLSFNIFAACPSGTRDIGEYQGQKACKLNNSYFDSKLVLTSENIYVLDGATFIGNDNKNNSELYIQAGTKVVGSSGADFLVITRGSKIFAEGTAKRPIVFTTAKTSDRKRGDWGGVIINGNAPINACNNDVPLCEAQGEGSTGLFGGNNPKDSSGVLKYVRVEFAGYPITPDNELNGIAFQGVGSGTEVDYIQVHMNADDGVEFFGGTVNVKHLVLTANEDDSLDWTMGWTGKAQFILVNQAKDAADNGIEADNNSSPQNATPRSNPSISNITFLGNYATKGGYGLLLRKGTAANISNAVITGFTKGCIDIDDAETFSNGARANNGNILATNLKLSHSVVWCENSKEFEDFDVAGEAYAVSKWFLSQEGNSVQNPVLNKWIPQEGSPLLFNGVTPEDEDFFFDFVDYIGAFDDFEDWTQGWITEAQN